MKIRLDVIGFCVVNKNWFKFQITPFGVKFHLPILITSVTALAALNTISVTPSDAGEIVISESPISFKIYGESAPNVSGLALPGLPGCDAREPLKPPNFLYSSY